ncbi:MAG: HigA family addiction module antidote protein [Methylocystaceae bacterium]|nr:HigA family addiction module antidote protein [Methylocystaceae bacterium]
MGQTETYKVEDINDLDLSDIVDGGTLDPVHPGEILKEEFLDPMEITPYRLAKAIHVPPNRINMIINGKRNITMDTAVRLAKFFGTSSDLWIGLQNHYDEDMLDINLDEIVSYEEIQHKNGQH